MMRAFCLFTCILIALSAPAAKAATIIRSVYQTDFLGLPISRSFVTMTLADKAYRIEGSGRTSLITGILVPMNAKFDASGAIISGAVHPETFDAHVKAGHDNYDIALKMKNGSVENEQASPPHDQTPDLVPVTDQMKHNIIDPLSAFVVPYSAKAPANICARTLPVYTGRERFDLVLSPSGKEKVSIPGLYEGEAEICAVRYRPLGGHRAEKKEIKYMIDNTDMHAWFVPLPGAPLMGLYKAEVGTKLGPVTVTLEKAGLGPAPEKKS